MSFNEWWLSHDGWFTQPPGPMKEAWEMLEDEGVDGQLIGAAFDLVGAAIAREFED